jgi:hypothetical protein
MGRSCDGSRAKTNFIDNCSSSQTMIDLITLEGLDVYYKK